MKLINKNKKNKGFTLIEIIVVLVIMVIMAAIAVPAVTGYIKDARESQYVQEADAIYTVVQTEEAKEKAETNAEPNDSFYNSLPAVINQKLDNEITVTEITHTAKSGSAPEKYNFKFTSSNGTAVEVEFSPNTNEMKVK